MEEARTIFADRLFGAPSSLNQKQRVRAIITTAMKHESAPHPAIISIHKLSVAVRIVSLHDQQSQ